MGMTANGRAILKAYVHIAAWGIWYVDASIDASERLTGRVSLALNDLALNGTALAGTPDRGRLPLRVIGGAGGWGKVLPGKSYANDAGVKVATIVRDAAESCGETFDASTASGVVGPAFVRPEGPASRVLELVAPGRWYVGEDGVTRLGRRPARVLPMGVTRVDNDRAEGTSTLASEAIAELLPGLVVDGVPVSDVEHEISPAKVRTKVWTERHGDGDRTLASLRRVFEALDPFRKFRATYEYRVDSNEGKRLNLSPLRAVYGMPSLLRVPVYPGVPGADADYERGAVVLVTFLNGDPSRPAVVGFGDASGESFVADELRFAEGTARAAREGDSVSISVGALNAAASPGTSFTTGVTGTISSGSSKVRIGG